MIKNKTDKIRLNRFIAMCGVCSRRKADDLIKKGVVTVNNSIVNSLGSQVSIKDAVCVKGKQVFPENKKYILLNKPKGYITTMSDEKGRKTVVSLINNSCKERLVPVGRLDKDTTGLLLFTNDGLLAKKLTHPKYEVKKIYNVTLDKAVLTRDINSISKGLLLEDGLAQVDNIKRIADSNKKINIEIHIGKNRIVRRIFEFLGYKVVELDRVEYACFKKTRLSIGKWRILSAKELKVLHVNN
jgi:23S rRNA pseudouridine2605 synthase